MLPIRFLDLLRATLPLRSGNEGWIGVSPAGSEYHIVVPVDVQIARGVMACNMPSDGTPFGGYTGWLYFRCPPFDGREDQDEILREERARQTAADVVKLLQAYAIEAVVVDA